MQIPLQPGSKQELRKFGLVMAAMTAIFFGILIPWIWGLGLSPWPWGVAAAFAGLALVWPPSLQPVYWLWMRIGLVLGWINTRLILGIVFYLVVLPTGLAVRLFRDPLQRRFERDAATYRRPSRQPVPDNLERPF